MKKVLLLAVLVMSLSAQAQYYSSTTYVDVIVMKDGAYYANPEVAYVLYGGNYTWNQAFYGPWICYFCGLPSRYEKITMTFALLPTYQEEVDYWTVGLNGPPVESQTLTATVDGGVINKIYCYLKPTQHPIIQADYPRANTTTGSPVVWGPKSMGGGKLRTYSGDLSETVIDLHVKGRGLDVVFARRYLSKLGVHSAVGKNWDFSYNIRVGNTLSFQQFKPVNFGSGRVVDFVFQPSLFDGKYDYYHADKWAAVLRRNYFSTDNEIEILFSDGARWFFNSSPDGIDDLKLLDYIEDKNGNRISFDYFDTDSDPADGVDETALIEKITDALGREYSFTYCPLAGEHKGMIASITDFAGRQVSYEYYASGDANGALNDLKSVTYPGGRTLTYKYFLRKMTEIIDARGNTVLKNTWNDGKVVKQERPHDTLTPVFNYTYTADRISASTYYPLTIVNDGLGNVQLQYYNRNNQLVKLREYTGRAPDPASPTTWDVENKTFAANAPTGKLRDADAYVVDPRVDPDYFETTFTWNEQDRLEQTMAPSGLSVDYVYEDESTPLKRGAVKEVIRSKPGEAEIFSVGYEYKTLEMLNAEKGLAPGAIDAWADDRIVMTSSRDELWKCTYYDYDPVGNLYSVQPPTFSEPIEFFEYNSHGQLEIHTLPPTQDIAGNLLQRQDKYYYYSTGGPQYGYLEKVERNYTGAKLTTSYLYHPVGTLAGITDPSGYTTTYDYNASDELTLVTAPQVTLESGSAIYETAYTYDQNGNVLTEEVGNYDEVGTDLGDIVTAHVYDSANRVKQIITDQGGIHAVTEYVYDANGNTVQVKTPLAVAGTEPTLVTDMVYDERGALFETTQFGRMPVRNDYDINGNVARHVLGPQTLSDPRNLVKTYDAFDRPGTTTLPNQTTNAVAQYDPRGMPEEEQTTGDAVTDLGAAKVPGGTLNQPRYQYDDRGLMEVMKIGADPVGKTMTYTPAGQVHTVTDPDGYVQTHGYDMFQRLVAVVDSKGNTTEYSYDANGNLTDKVQTDVPDGPGSTQTLTTHYTYDELNRLVATSDQTSRTSLIWCDSRGNPVKAVDPNGNYTRKTIDNLGRVTKVEFFNAADVLLATTEQAYDLNSRLISRKDPNGKHTTYTYNPQGYNDTITYDDGGSHSFDYDPFGNVVQATDPAGNVIAYEYDKMNRMTWRYTTATADGMDPIVEAYEYDGLGRLVFAGNQNTSVLYAYDLMADEPTVLETIWVDVAISLSSGDAGSGDIYENFIGQNSTWRRVARTFTHGGRLVHLSYPGGAEITYDYQAGGQLDKIRENDVLIADYDYIGPRLAKRSLIDKIDMDFAYSPATHGAHIAGITHTRRSDSTTLENWTLDWDGAYNKTSRHDTGRNKNHTYLYDGLNRMTQSSLNGTVQTVYDLDPAGNRAYSPYVVDPASVHEYSASPRGSLEYDNNGNLTNAPDEFTINLYDALNELMDRWGYGTVLQDPFAGVISEDYNILTGDFTAAEGYLDLVGAQGGRIINDTVPADMDHVNFSYLSQHDPAAGGFGPEKYALFLMKIEQEALPAPDDEWSYLALVIEPTRISLNKWEADSVVEVGSAPVVSAQNDWYDIQVVFSGTNNEDVQINWGLHGDVLNPIINVSTGLTNTSMDLAFGIGDDGGYLFDNLRIHADSINAPSMEEEYIYDVFGRRVARTWYENYVAQTVYYAYDGTKVIEELDAEGNIAATYVYGQYIDEPLEMARDDAADGTYEWYYYLHDDQYNVLAVVDVNGNIVERYEYGDYGKPTIYDASGNLLSASAIGNPYMFNSRRYDEQTGLYYYRTRYLDPVMGRFISRDTIGLWGDPNNLGNPYSYCGNNPWSRLDPLGRQVVSAGATASGSVGSIGGSIEAGELLEFSIKGAMERRIGGKLEWYGEGIMPADVDEYGYFYDPVHDAIYGNYADDGNAGSVFLFGTVTGGGANLQNFHQLPAKLLSPIKSVKNCGFSGSLDWTFTAFTGTREQFKGESMQVGGSCALGGAEVIKGKEGGYGVTLAIPARKAPSRPAEIHVQKGYTVVADQLDMNYAKLLLEMPTRIARNARKIVLDAIPKCFREEAVSQSAYSAVEGLEKH